MKALKRGIAGEKQKELNEFLVRSEVQALTKKTYAQDWPAYNAAKTREKLLCMQMLLELIEEATEEPKRAQHHFSLKEQLVCMFVYVYSGFSGRRAISDINLAMKAGFLRRAPHFNSVFNMFHQPFIYDLLTKLVEITSLPLREFEDHLAVDSSGFSTSCFERWADIKDGPPEKRRKWKKVHLIVGPRTNIITGICVTEGFESDTRQLPYLVQRAAPLFHPRDISADKAYSSRENLSVIAQHGAIPFIPFKKNARINSKGSAMWRAMWQFFFAHNEEFMKRYHPRSNVESTFHMIKTAFGRRLRFKDAIAQYNEILMKCLCHNLAVLVQETFEMGLKIDFQDCANVRDAQDLANKPL